MSGILLDTHVWLWFMTGSKELSVTSQTKIDHCLKDGMAFVAAISSWELCMLETKGRIQLTMPAGEWIQQSFSQTSLTPIDLRPDIAFESCHLPGTFHGDPADRLIVATARIEGLTLMTRDTKIHTYSKSNTVTVVEC